MFARAGVTYIEFSFGVVINGGKIAPSLILKVKRGENPQSLESVNTIALVVIGTSSNL